MKTETQRIKRILAFLFLVSLSISYMGASPSIPDKTLEASAKKGDVTTMIQLGKWYEERMAGNRDNAKKAAEWYKKAMTKGSAEGRWRYAGVIAGGATGKSNIKEAMKVLEGVQNEQGGSEFLAKAKSRIENSGGQGYLLCAALLGNPEAMFLASTMSMEGELYGNPVLKYRSQSSEMLKKASEKFVPALVWGALYANNYDLKDAEYFSMKEKALPPKAVSFEDIKYAMEFSNYALLTRLVKIKGGGNADTQMEILNSVSALPEGYPSKRETIEYLTTNCSLKKDTLFLDQLLSFNPRDTKLEEKIRGYELKNIPERKYRAALYFTKGYNLEALSYKRPILEALEAEGLKGNKEADELIWKNINKWKSGKADSEYLGRVFDRIISRENLKPEEKDKIVECIIADLKYPPKDYAVEWSKKWAAKGSGRFQGNLGEAILYQARVKNSRNPPQDMLKEARMWMEMAAKNGHPEYLKTHSEYFKSPKNGAPASKPAKGKPQKQQKPAEPKKKGTGGFQESGLKR